jgi:hypothetical protein
MKIPVYIIVLFIIQSCASNKTEESLTGIWYNCAKDGYYIEMHILNNQYRYSTNRLEYVMKPCELQLSGDTLIQFNTGLYKDSAVINKAIITFINPDQFKLEYLTSDEIWILTRAEAAISDFNNDSEILKGTKDRATELPCIDKRSEEERKKDTLNRQIDFVF